MSDGAFAYLAFQTSRKGIYQNVSAIRAHYSCYLGPYGWTARHLCTFMERSLTKSYIYQLVKTCKRLDSA